MAYLNVQADKPWFIYYLVTGHFLSGDSVIYNQVMTPVNLFTNPEPYIFPILLQGLIMLISLTRLTILGQYVLDVDKSKQSSTVFHTL